MTWRDPRCQECGRNRLRVFRWISLVFVDKQPERLNAESVLDVVVQPRWGRRDKRRVRGVVATLGFGI